MRTPRRKLHLKQAATPQPLVDASGHVFDADRYQDKNGVPRISSKGNFYLQRGKTHAE